MYPHYTFTFVYDWFVLASLNFCINPNLDLMLRTWTVKKSEFSSWNFSDVQKILFQGAQINYFFTGCYLIIFEFLISLFNIKHHII